jgi:hypothetical protein
MKATLSACLLLALAVAAHAQDSQDNLGKPVPDINKSPWSGGSITKNDGPTGTSTTTLKRDVGEGWAVGGQMTTPYKDPALGGSGPPSNPLEGPRSGHTILGPYLEKKF